MYIQRQINISQSLLNFKKTRQNRASSSIPLPCYMKLFLRILEFTKLYRKLFSPSIFPLITRNETYKTTKFYDNFCHQIFHKCFKFSTYRDIKKKTQNYRHKNIVTFFFCQFFQVKKIIFLVPSVRTVTQFRRQHATNLNISEMSVSAIPYRGREVKTAPFLRDLGERPASCIAKLTSPNLTSPCADSHLLFRSLSPLLQSRRIPRSFLSHLSILSSCASFSEGSC